MPTWVTIAAARGVAKAEALRGRAELEAAMAEACTADREHAKQQRCMETALKLRQEANRIEFLSRREDKKTLLRAQGVPDDAVVPPPPPKRMVDEENWKCTVAEGVVIKSEVYVDPAFRDAKNIRNEVPVPKCPPGASAGSGGAPGLVTKARPTEAPGLVLKAPAPVPAPYSSTNTGAPHNFTH